VRIAGDSDPFGGRSATCAQCCLPLRLVFSALQECGRRHSQWGELQRHWLIISHSKSSWCLNKSYHQRTGTDALTRESICRLRDLALIRETAAVRRRRFQVGEITLIVDEMTQSKKCTGDIRRVPMAVPRGWAARVPPQECRFPDGSYERNDLPRSKCSMRPSCLHLSRAVIAICPSAGRLVCLSLCPLPVFVWTAMPSFWIRGKRTGFKYFQRLFPQSPSAFWWCRICHNGWPETTFWDVYVSLNGRTAPGGEDFPKPDILF
jgi:hypothetical protein